MTLIRGHMVGAGAGHWSVKVGPGSGRNASGPPRSVGSRPRYDPRQITVKMPTDEIDARCRNLCTWVVVRATTAGKPAVSRLKYPSAMCAVHGGGAVDEP